MLVTKDAITADEFMVMLAARAEEIKPWNPKRIRVERGISGERRRLLLDNVAVSDEGFAKVCSYLSVPAGFIQRAPFDLANDIVARMAKAPEVEERQLVRRRNDIVGHHPRAQKSVPSISVFEKLLKELPSTEKVYVDATDASVSARVVCRDLEIKPKKDDIVRGGLHMFYSEMLTKPPSIQAYTERLVCLNGMIHRDYEREFQFTELDVFLEELTPAVHDCVAYITETVDAAWKKTAGMEVDGPQTIRRIFQQYRLNTKYLDAVLAAHMVEGDGTVYGVLNAFTRAANQFRSDSAYTRLQLASGAALKDAARAHCPQCYAAL